MKYKFFNRLFCSFGEIVKMSPPADFSGRRGTRQQLDGDDDNEGWEVGFDVEMNGVGRVEGFFEDDSSPAPSDDDEENSHVSAAADQNVDDRRLPNNGYVLLSSGIPPPPQENHQENAFGLEEFEIPVDGLESQNQGTNMFSEAPTTFSKHLLPRPSLDPAFRINEHESQDIPLNSDKVTEIKSIMSQINVKPPPWVQALQIDEMKLSEYLKEIKARRQ